MAAFADGVPCVCIPLGRDQRWNAARAAELGAGLALPADPPEETIRDAVEAALASDALREGAARLQAATAAYGNGVVGVEALERLARRR
jgi:UDP:flavonoid glycosyltransferase YjiC (YdhE family)